MNQTLNQNMFSWDIRFNTDIRRPLMPSVNGRSANGSLKKKNVSGQIVNGRLTQLQTHVDLVRLSPIIFIATDSL